MPRLQLSMVSDATTDCLSGTACEQVILLLSSTVCSTFKLAQSLKVLS